MLDKTIDGKYTLIGLKEKGEAFQSHLAHYHLLGTQVMVDLIYPGRLAGGAVPLSSRLDTLLTLRHPAICRVFAWGEEEDYLFVVREYTHGTLLSELLQESGDLPPEQSLELLRILVGGLGALHGRGIYFLGLSPHQVWMDRGGKAGLVRPGYSFLLEREDERLSREAAPYWAPEVLAGGEGTRASDVFSLGVMARRLLSSRRDDQELWRALREASTFDPARRPSSARIFLEQVEKLMSRPADGQPVMIPVNQPVSQPGPDSTPPLPTAAQGEDPDHLSPRERLERLVRSQAVDMMEPPSRHGGGTKRRLRLVLAGAGVVLAAVLILRFAGSASHAPQVASGTASPVEVGEESPEQQLVMPDLRGMESAQARRLLQEMGLEVEVISEPSNVIPEGKVIIQEPLKGEYMRRGSKVTVYVSTGPLRQQTTDSGAHPDPAGRYISIPAGDPVPGRGNARLEPRGSSGPQELMCANPEWRDHAS
jgi:hypothetical protein